MKNYKGFQKGINAILESGVSSGLIGYTRYTRMSGITSVYISGNAKWTNDDWDGFSKELYKKLKDEYK